MSEDYAFCPPGLNSCFDCGCDYIALKVKIRRFRGGRVETPIGIYALCHVCLNERTKKDSANDYSDPEPGEIEALEVLDS